ncbi:quinoprotein dehydrogenase-associated SoxYZ-like carrier [Erythrobacter neustonensis]|uniref:Quinoprotein dehydrogenase-associated SoxYZ-like carrier n=1 Tax=Erythrobacter neustonensis TaxID=1112 RepID=A0A192D6M3_9SPHN|nr:quinoprotein dehydrogenase-associated SoxYZ-like carrier [Erythrobacter neustonensis]
MRKLLSLAALIVPAAALAEAPPADPLGSPMWAHHAGKLFGGAPVMFDPQVKVDLPMLAENQHVLPVTVDARALGKVTRIVIFADLNPIPIAVEYTPLAAHAFVATRIKLDQRTPVRAAVLTADGVWHVAGAWVDAAGGGCSAPPLSRVRGDWADHLGELRGAVWHGADGARVRLSLRHPMDTGLVENIAAYNIEQVTIADAQGALLARMVVHGSVSEDPAFTLMLAPVTSGDLAVRARDTGGMEFSGSLSAASGPRIAAATLR